MKYDSEQNYRLVLAVYLSSRGFAFVLFEGSLSPYDWGVHATRGPRKNACCLRRIKEILNSYQPDAVVLQDTTSDGTRRANRIQGLNLSICEVADERGVPQLCLFARSCTAVLGGLVGLLQGGLGGLLGGGAAGGILSGGLNDLLKQFQTNGAGDKAESWVSTGPNKPIQPNELERALGEERSRGSCSKRECPEMSCLPV